MHKNHSSGLYIFGNFPLIILNTILRLLYKMKTIKDILMKRYTFYR